jgi:hypothetical protein
MERSRNKTNEHSFGTYRDLLKRPALSKKEIEENRSRMRRLAETICAAEGARMTFSSGKKPRLAPERFRIVH